MFEQWLSRQNGPAAVSLRRWMTRSEPFRLFVLANAPALRGKLSRAKNESQALDLAAELEFAFRGLSVPGVGFELLPAGSSLGRTPDYRVTVPGGGRFILEVKRVQDHGDTNRLHTFIDNLRTAVKRVPSGRLLSVNITPDDQPLPLLQRLERAADTIRDRCVESLQQCAGRDLTESGYTIPLPDFDTDELAITITPLAGQPADAPTIFGPWVEPVMYTQTEFRRFSDTLCDSLGQLRSGEANAIGLRLHSSTHDERDIDQAMWELLRRTRVGDDSFFVKKEFASAADFLTQLKRLSAAVVLTDWKDYSVEPRNHLWTNPDAAVPLEPQVEEFLRSL